MKIGRVFNQIIHLLPLMALVVIVLGSSSIPPGDRIQNVRAFTRQIEFDFIRWTLDAFQVKFNQLALGTANYLSSEQQHKLVVDYLDLVLQIQRAESELNQIYADPNIKDPEAASLDIRQELDRLYQQRSQLAPFAETVLQTQLSNLVSEFGLSVGGQPIPPILYHSTRLPWALIISPRDQIRQEANISLDPELTVDQHVALEEQVDEAIDVSSLVVGIGGIGLYPTMVNQTSNLNWLSEVVAHEWIHNYLSLRPLGVNYFTSPELRTMNETAASIAGKEIGLALLERYYPEFVPPPPTSPSPSADDPSPPEPPVFDFQDEMRETRLKVDELLAAGQIEAAEEYMEQRRQVFWENGYLIRKINQAYFAFYGAYADIPGGAAGEDPVGAAVRELRAQSGSLTEFLKRISWMTSFEQLQQSITKKRTES